MKTLELDQKFPFSEFTGRGVKVAVIDSGIDDTHPLINVKDGICICNDEQGKVRVSQNYSDNVGHGTACAGIICNIAPNIELFSVKIFDESLFAPGEYLVQAILWAIDNQIDVVNLSLGVIDVTFRDRIADICQEASGKGVILISAKHNQGMESFPADVEDCIGVAGGRLYGKYDYYYNWDNGFTCIARGNRQRVCWLNGQEMIVEGTSFAAPHISGIIALIKEALPEAKTPDIKRILKKNATPTKVTTRDIRTEKQFDFNTTSELSEDNSGYDWINNVALYPFNKEMHAFVRYQDLLSFSIVSIADPIGKRMVGKDAGIALGIEPVGIRIQSNIEDSLDSADTLILGYIDQLAHISKRDLLKEIIQSALDKDCNVFSFLPVPKKTYSDLYSIAQEKGLRLAYPLVTPSEFQAIIKKYNGKSVDVPVLGVIGTSSNQGKFTVQLALRRELMSSGYTIGQIGTEHHSELFGMDAAFPIGYATPVRYPAQDYIPYLTNKLKEIYLKKRPDIFILGSQSGTIPYNIDDPTNVSISTLSFLLGTKPDACILVVNSIDEDKYIQDTIDVVRGLVKAPTILLAMSDKAKHVQSAYGRTFVTPKQMSPQQINVRLQQLEETFDIPAVEIVSPEGQRKMANVVVNYFSEA